MQTDPVRPVMCSSPAGSLTTGATASRLGVSGMTVRRYADAGVLPCTRLPGGGRRFRPDDVDALLRAMNASVDA